MDSRPPRPDPATQPDLALRGGLKGRLAGDFCVLQGMVEALTRYLEKEAPEPVRATGLEALDEMARRLRRLERLSANAADLALGAALRGLHVSQPMDLAACLREVCDCSNEELSACGAALRMSLCDQTMTGDLWLEGDVALVGGIAANLMSNALVAGAGRIKWTCTDDRRLLYRDDGPGLPGAAADLLRGKVPEGVVPAVGGTGLLLVREYAAALGWTLEVGEQSGGLALTFILPQHVPDPSGLLLSDDSHARQCRSCALRQLFRRELAVLGDAP